MSLPCLKDVLVSLHEDVVVSMKGMSSSHPYLRLPQTQDTGTRRAHHRGGQDTTSTEL
jgi:hypothetical protein